MKTILNKKNRSIFSMLKYILPIFIILMSSACKKKECKYTDGFPHPCNKGMDVAFLVDYTGSMGPAINDIKASVTAIAAAINTQSAGNYRLALSIFDEQGKGGLPAYTSQADYTSLPAANKIVNIGPVATDQYLTTMETFSLANNATFSTQLAKLNGSMSLGTGFGVAEPGGMLLDKVINSGFAGTWRTGISKLAIIITDAPDGGDDDNATAVDDAFLATLAAQANAAQIQCILVTTLPASNYEIQLIGNNTLGLKVVKSNFTTVSTDIIQIINQVCQ
ncbi:MAG TPA: hypothetical protein PK431_14270 [Chitinophagales bacterium]|nr:hypothetical protein [Chitinophagales bacterium]